MKTRGLGNLTVVVFDKDMREREIDIEDLKLLSSGIKKIIIKKINRINIQCIFLILQLILFKVLNKNLKPIKEKLVSYLFGFDIQRYKIKLNEITFILEGDYFLCELLREIILHNQYNVTKKNVYRKIIVDAGANVGVFSILCAKLGAKRVLAFEPIEEICLKLEKNIQHNSLRNKITVVNKGLGNEQKRIKIGFDFYENEAEIVPLDMFLRGRRVDFIKIDVEGFEKEVILGAKETVRKYKPILSLSAYHKPDDKQILPSLIKSIRPDYDIILNKFDEEDLFCK